MRQNAQLAGRRAILTGSGSGIGAAIAKRFAAEGAEVIIADRSAEAAAHTVDEVTAAGGTAYAFPMDVSDQVQVMELFTFADERIGGVDLLVNGAGILRRASFLDIEEADWEAQIRVNSLGPLLCTQQAARRFIERPGLLNGRGKIINICSTWSRQPTEGFAAFSASNAALMSLTQSSAKALAPYGASVNGIGVGLIDTSFWAGRMPEHGVASVDNAALEIRMGAPGVPEDIAPLAVFLASEGSDYMTGQIIMVDGGTVMA